MPSQTPLFFPSAGVLYPIVFVARILFASCNLFFFTVSIPFLRHGRAKRIYQIGRFDVRYEDVHVGSRGEDHGLWAIMEGKDGYSP